MVTYVGNPQSHTVLVRNTRLQLAIALGISGIKCAPTSSAFDVQDYAQKIPIHIAHMHELQQSHL